MSKPINSQTATTGAKTPFQALIEKSPDCFLMIDTGGKLLYVSPVISQILGYRQSEFLKLDIFSLVHPDDLAVTTKLFQKIITKTGTSATSEVRLKHKNGSWCWLEAPATYMPESFGKNIIIATLRDISHQKKYQDKLNYQTAVLTAHNEATPEGILVVDTKGNMLFHNSRFIELWKIPKKIMAANDDTAALRFGMTRLVNPQEFIETSGILIRTPP